ncbi:MAG TPA: hypothetical protein ENI29_23040 [bacterium]|nr:hypothetical protein [bacterium]
MEFLLSYSVLNPDITDFIIYNQDELDTLNGGNPVISSLPGGYLKKTTLNRNNFIKNGLT